VIFLLFLAASHISRVNGDEIMGQTKTICKQELFIDCRVFHEHDLRFLVGFVLGQE